MQAPGKVQVTLVGEALCTWGEFPEGLREEAGLTGRDRSSLAGAGRVRMFLKEQ